MAPAIRPCVVLFLAGAVLVTTGSASAQDPAAAERLRGDEEARCAERLRPLERAIESDWRYATSWRDAWIVTGAALIALNLAGAFSVSGYRRTEGIVTAAQSSLLMIQQPAAAETRSLHGAGAIDPCLALLDARDVLEANADDASLHTSAIAHVLAIAVPVLTGAILAGATGHFDFVGNGNEGVTTLVGVALGELQVLTYPRPSVKMSGTSLTVSF